MTTLNDTGLLLVAEAASLQINLHGCYFITAMNFKRDTIMRLKIQSNEGNYAASDINTTDFINIGEPTGDITVFIMRLYSVLCNNSANPLPDFSFCTDNNIQHVYNYNSVTDEIIQIDQIDHFLCHIIKLCGTRNYAELCTCVERFSLKSFHILYRQLYRYSIPLWITRQLTTFLFVHYGSFTHNKYEYLNKFFSIIQNSYEINDDIRFINALLRKLSIAFKTNTIESLVKTIIKMSKSEIKYSYNYRVIIKFLINRIAILSGDKNKYLTDFWIMVSYNEDHTLFSSLVLKISAKITEIFQTPEDIARINPISYAWHNSQCAELAANPVNRRKKEFNKYCATEEGAELKRLTMEFLNCDIAITEHNTADYHKLCERATVEIAKNTIQSGGDEIFTSETMRNTCRVCVMLLLNKKEDLKCYECSFNLYYKQLMITEASRLK